MKTFVLIFTVRNLKIITLIFRRGEIAISPKFFLHTFVILEDYYIVGIINSIIKIL